MENKKDRIDTEKIVSEILEQKEIFNDVEEELLHDLISGKVSRDTDMNRIKTLTFGDKMADKIAS